MTIEHHDEPARPSPNPLAALATPLSPEDFDSALTALIHVAGEEQGAWSRLEELVAFVEARTPADAGTPPDERNRFGPSGIPHEDFHARRFGAAVWACDQRLPHRLRWLADAIDVMGYLDHSPSGAAFERAGRLCAFGGLMLRYAESVLGLGTCRGVTWSLLASPGGRAERERLADLLLVAAGEVSRPMPQRETAVVTAAGLGLLAQDAANGERNEAMWTPVEVEAKSTRWAPLVWPVVARLLAGSGVRAGMVDHLLRSSRRSNRVADDVFDVVLDEALGLLGCRPSGIADLDRRRRFLLGIYRDAGAGEASRDALQAMTIALADAADAWRKADVSTTGSEEAATDGATPGTAEFVRQGGASVSQADLIVTLCDELEVECWESRGGEAYATVRADGHIENWLVASRDFRRWAQRQFYERHEKVARRESLADALGVLQGRAMGGEKRDVYVRVAGHDGNVYVDLGDADRNVVVITPAGWSVTQDVPVRFRRPPGMLPLPKPVRAGSIAALRPLINVPDDDAWVLLIGYLLGCLRPDGPYIVLVLLGEQGTAKSTLARIICLLIDPKDAPLRRPPKEERDLSIAARNGYLICWNNVSQLSDTLSDAVSTLATEGGFATRTLFENDEETRFKDRRPAILNGIDDFVSKGDMADRSCKLFLSRIRRGGRRLEKEVLGEVEALRPGILGVLFDAVSAALRNEPGLTVADLPRMADAARWITAGETAFGWAPGTFLAAYHRMASESIAAVVEASPVAQAIRAFAKPEPWRGAAGALLKELAAANEPLTKRKDWPSSPQGMSSILRRYAPSLRDLGLVLEQDKEEDRVLRTKLWTVGLAVATSSAEPAPSTPPVQAQEAWTCPDCGAFTNDAHECPRRRS